MGIGWPVALQLSSTLFSHVEAEMFKTQCFSHFSSLEGIFKASFCTAWANSKFRKCAFVEAKLSCFSRWKKVWSFSFEVTTSMFSQNHAGQQPILKLCHKHFGSSSRMEENMAALRRQWKLRAHCRCMITQSSVA